MFRNYIICLAALGTLLSTPASAAPEIQSFIPAGWEIVNSSENVIKPGFDSRIARGDLNKDGIEDAATVIQNKSKTIEARGCGKNIYKEKSQTRTLLIMLGQKTGGYKLSAKNSDIILRSNEGGVMGDPFQGVKIERGTLVINHSGGSNWRWEKTSRFRYNNTEWQLIGYTEVSFFTGDGRALAHDFNLLSGKIKITRKAPQKSDKPVIKWKKVKAPAITLKMATCWKPPFTETLGYQ